MSRAYEKESVTLFLLSNHLFSGEQGFQYISKDEMKWKESLSIMIISMIVLLFALLLFNWSKSPYDWKKDRDV